MSLSNTACLCKGPYNYYFRKIKTSSFFFQSWRWWWILPLQQVFCFAPKSSGFFCWNIRSKFTHYWYFCCVLLFFSNFILFRSKPNTQMDWCSRYKCRWDPLRLSWASMHNIHRCRWPFLKFPMWSFGKDTRFQRPQSSSLRYTWGLVFLLYTVFSLKCNKPLFICFSSCFRGFLQFFFCHNQEPTLLKRFPHQDWSVDLDRVHSRVRTFWYSTRDAA